MVCGTPSSVTAKSFAVRPINGFPFLSFTTTASTTNCVLTLIEGVCAPLGAAFWPICCVPAAARVHANVIAITVRMASEPYAQRSLETAHGVGSRWQSKLCTVDDRVPRCERHVIENVCGIHTQVEIESTVQAECASHGRIEAELSGAVNGVPSSISPLPCHGYGVSRWIQRQT